MSPVQKFFDALQKTYRIILKNEKIMTLAYKDWIGRRVNDTILLPANGILHVSTNNPPSEIKILKCKLAQKRAIFSKRIH